jgi:hypothetical protein
MGSAIFEGFKTTEVNLLPSGKLILEHQGAQ